MVAGRLKRCGVVCSGAIYSYNQPSEFISTVSYLLQYARDDSTLALLVRIISGTITMHVPNDGPDVIMDSDRYQGFIKTAVEHALRDAVLADTEIKRCFIEDNVPKDQKTYVHYYCLNIIKLLRWENSNQVSHLRTRPIGRAVEANLYGIGGALKEYTSLLRPRPPCTMASLDEMPTCHALAEVLDRVDMSGTKSPPPSVEVLIKVVQSTVKYFFRCLHEKDIMDKLRGVQTACRLLRKLCIHSKMARSVALRDLLETAMFREEKAFGSRPVVANTVAASKDWPQDDLLINLNQKHGPITQLTQSHTSVFHAGIIGKGVRKLDEIEDYLPPVLTANNELLMGALMSCMDGNSGIVEGMTSVSLLLVELVAPDVMYNGLPWPDEDFTKQVSIERELYMRCALEACVVARSALRRCAGARPSLCLASSLLRAVAATLLHRLKALLGECVHAALAVPGLVAAARRRRHAAAPPQGAAGRCWVSVYMRPSLCLASSLLRAVAATLLHRLKALLGECVHAALAVPGLVAAARRRRHAAAPPQGAAGRCWVSVYMRPSLCLASSLLRAVAATLLHRLKALLGECVHAALAVPGLVAAARRRRHAAAPPQGAAGRCWVSVYMRPSLCLASSLLRAVAATLLHRLKALLVCTCGPRCAWPRRCCAPSPPRCCTASRRCWVSVYMRPSLCLASSLLRAVAATLLHRLKALLDRHTHAAEISRERAALCDLLTTMTLGQLLPHPLSHMLEMAPELTANEIVQVIRDCLWNYTRDNVPSPALFPCDSTGLHWRDPVSCKPSTTYTDTLRLILQKRIGRLGHLYPTMFLNLEKDAQ
ncbi:uncharacterized protein LOC135071326 [Ostrinia nubilalis]|uniref:uncharacterized protein LOC135071326 n=1 Tax=Ostrinia nubilalis TaxID=29057 RepID=UPI0030824868